MNPQLCRTLTAILLAMGCASSAHAYNFGGYAPTLGATSAYALSFVPGAAGSLVTSYAWNGASLNTGYYDINLNYPQNGVAMSSNVTYLGLTRQDITGYFFDHDFVSAGMNGGAGIYVDNSVGGQKLVGTITGDFIHNTISDTSGQLWGGALLNSGDITAVRGDFVYNAIAGGGSVPGAMGGAIGNFDEAANPAARATIGTVTGNFLFNSVTNVNNLAIGGGIFNAGTINAVNGDFIGNFATSSNEWAGGGAIFNDGEYTWIPAQYTVVKSIRGNFIGNYAQSTGSYALGGAIFNNYGATIGDVAGDFIGNWADGAASGGGAIYNAGTVATVVGNFVGNGLKNSAAVTQIGGAILNDDGAVMTVGGGSNFYGNAATLVGGAIAMSNSVVTLDTTGGNINFDGNTAAGAPNDIAMSGAAILNVSGGNKVLIGDGIDSDAATATIAKDATGEMILGASAINENFQGTFAQTAGTTTVYGQFFNAAVANNITNSTINFWGDGTDYGEIQNIAFANATVSTMNGVLNDVKIANISLTGTNNFDVDIDGANAVSDRFIVSGGINTNAAPATFNLRNFALLTEPNAETVDVQVFDAAAPAGTDFDNIGFTASATRVDTSAYQYSVLSLQNEDMPGWYRLTRSASLSNTGRTVENIPALDLSVIKVGMTELPNGWEIYRITMALGRPACGFADMRKI